MSVTLVTSPVVTFSDAPDPVATSRYNAVHNPILYSFQRKDYLITNIVVTGTQGDITSGTPYAESSMTGDYVYVSGNAAIPDGKYLVINYTAGAGGHIFIDLTGTGIAAGTYAGGYVNLNTTRKSYRLEVQIGMMDSGSFVPLVTAAWVPNVAGVITVDVSQYLKPQLPLTNAFTYLLVNQKDLNLSRIYALKYREVWTGNTAGSFSSATTNDYATNSAKQIMDLYGGNMAEFVPDDNDIPVAKKAKFVSGFLNPHWWNGYPFDLSFIYANVLSTNVTRVVTPRDVNLAAGTPLSALMKPAGRYYINRMGFAYYTYNYSAITEVFPHNFTLQLEIDGVMTAIGGGFFSTIADIVAVISAYLGPSAVAFFIPSTSIQIQATGGYVYGVLAVTNTDLAVTHPYTPSATYIQPSSIYPGAYYLDVKLTYSTPFDITETKRIRLENDCTKHPVYLAWKSKNGAWDYWLFDWNQTLKRNIGDLQQYEPYITDFALATSRIKVSSKTSVPSMVLGASGVAVNDVYYNEQFPGLTGLLESVEVLQLMNPLTWLADLGPKWRTVIPKPGSFTVMETKNRNAEVQLEISLPYLQVESQ